MRSHRWRPFTYLFTAKRSNRCAKPRGNLFCIHHPLHLFKNGVFCRAMADIRPCERKSFIRLASMLRGVKSYPCGESLEGADGPAETDILFLCTKNMCEMSGNIFLPTKDEL